MGCGLRDDRECRRDQRPHQLTEAEQHQQRRRDRVEIAEPLRKGRSEECECRQQNCRCTEHRGTAECKCGQHRKRGDAGIADRERLQNPSDRIGQRETLRNRAAAECQHQREQCCTEQLSGIADLRIAGHAEYKAHIGGSKAAE